MKSMDLSLSFSFFFFLFVFFFYSFLFPRIVFLLQRLDNNCFYLIDFNRISGRGNGVQNFKEQKKKETNEIRKDTVNGSIWCFTI